jgi:hypothetical protein
MPAPNPIEQVQIADASLGSLTTTVAPANTVPTAPGPLSTSSRPPAAPARSGSAGQPLLTPKRNAKRAAVKVRRSSLSLVIPARNEARNVATVLDHLPSCVDEVILVDGRSSDVTQLMALTCRPDIRIINEPAPGKGHALRAGFEAARGDVIVAMDADGSMLPDEIPQILYFLDHGYDFLKGSRFVGGGGSLDITPLRKLGNRGLLMLANQFFDTQLTDLCYGFFGFRRQYLDHLGLTSTGFEIETELTVRAVTSGLRIAEVPSLEMPRRSGKSNLRSVRDGLRVLQILLRERAARLDQPPAVHGVRPESASTAASA